MRTLEQILQDVNSVLDLENATPSGDELTTRQNYANQAVWDASSLGQLSEFKREYIGLATQATVSLPTNFRELQEWPRLLDSTGNWQKYEPIEMEQKYDKVSTDSYCYVMGNPAEGYSLYINNLITNATISVIYQRYPSGLSTLTDVCELPDPEYVVRKVEAYVLYSRSDDRLQVAEQKAERQLANMMGREMKSSTGEGRSTKMKFRHPLQNLS